MLIKFLKIREEHLEKIRLWRMSKEVTRYMYTDPKITPDDQKKWYQRILKDFSRMDWVVSVDGMDTGVICLYDIEPVNRSCFWAYYLGEQAARGRGIGKEIELNILNYVFEHLRLHKLCCEVFEWNDLVVKIHQKYGCQIEGVFREHIWKSGQYHNVVRLGILRQDWEQKIKDKVPHHPAEIEEWEDKKQNLLKFLPGTET